MLVLRVLRVLRVQKVQRVHYSTIYCENTLFISIMASILCGLEHEFDVYSQRLSERSVASNESVQSQVFS